MSELEKLKKHQIYRCGDAEISVKIKEAYKLCLEYQNKYLEKNNILTQLLGSVGENVTITPPMHFDFGFNTTIGNNSYINCNVVILDTAKVEIGSNVFIGPNVSLICPIHPLDYKTRNEGYELSKPIVIEDNVWIGANVVVLPGVTIKSGAVIGAGSVVSHDVEGDTLNHSGIKRLINQEEKDPKFS